MIETFDLFIVCTFFYLCGITDLKTIYSLINLFIMSNLRKHIENWISQSPEKINLRKYVENWISQNPEKIEDVLNYGCISGTVNELMYYSDTLKFYDDYKEEINYLINQLGIEITTLNGFDSNDILCLETNNQNLLAWFGFEVTLSQLYEQVY